MSEKRIALVTGGNKGIGLEIARQLARAGVVVIIGARDETRARAAIEELASDGLSAGFVHLDLGDWSSATAAAEKISAEHGLARYSRQQCRNIRFCRRRTGQG